MIDLEALAKKFILQELEDPEYMGAWEFLFDEFGNTGDVDKNITAFYDLLASAKVEITW